MSNSWEAIKFSEQSELPFEQTIFEETLKKWMSYKSRIFYAALGTSSQHAQARWKLTVVVYNESWSSRAMK